MYNNIIVYLHILVGILIIICSIVLDYIYLPYIMLFTIFIIIGWFLNYNCFLKEHDNFIKIYYNKYTFIIIIFCLLLSIIRYQYQYNSTHLNTTIVLSVLFITYFFLFIILIPPALHHYIIYNNARQFYIYITYFMCLCIAYYFYITN